MKAIKLTIKNIGIIADTVIELNRPLILFYGEIRQGKTTILNSVKWVFGGSFPTDIIRRGETEAYIRLDLDCGSILRSFYVARDGSTKARPVIYEQNGVPVRDAVAEIKKLLNPFLLDQDYLRAMSELERKKYFASLFTVDTAPLDAEIAATEAKAVGTRAKLKAYGDIDLSPVAPPADITALQGRRANIIQLHREAQRHLHGELAKRRDDYASALRQVQESNRQIRAENDAIAHAEKEIADDEARITTWAVEIDILRKRIESVQVGITLLRTAIAGKERGIEQPLTAPPDTRDLEQQISAAANTEEVDKQLRQAEADWVRFEQHQKNKLRQREREQDEALILSLDATVRELRSKKLAQLKHCGETSGIPGLSFDEAGNFIYEGCQAGMLSTSQLMGLSSHLSALYPDGFGIDLIDRAESLGRSIFEFVDQAKAENKTILAAIVGEKPATVPADVGVFVVEGGAVKQTPLI
jgi:DNA repair exonuclease SbcCD ATPase subunit